ncbi:SSI family serine proteinase inhibitor [Actinokineospora diospyrosa]|uniref:Subtilisin inhibitor-like n=1 Tax=Actinokineospora diospyrosa TaxID=103728 RepID=A0ABT1I6W1_9PSEU|nr:SSI family serine proteinase inhibitor [Actinokineospora diospyrosa]MCP2268309.1 Subtilisin inhibitor-like [Actinokineospora diospyrosa]
MSAKSLAVAAVCASVAALVPATTANATIAPVRAGFVLTVDRAGDLPRLAVLQCAPDAGTVVDPVAACAQLSQVNGRFERLNVVPNAMCTLEYDPVVVTAAGLWGRRAVHYRAVFGNRCELRTATGAVFGI